MSGLFGGGGTPPPPPKMPEPKVTRMPAETDPSIVAAGKRTREKYMRRKGRLSTIMTDNIGSSVVGSSGKQLGV